MTDDSTMLTEADVTLLDTNFSPEREKELEDKGIILNYRVVSSPSDTRSDNQKVLDRYQAGRAKHHLNSTLIPLIQHSARNPFDVAGDAIVQYTITALRGSMASENKAN